MSCRGDCEGILIRNVEGIEGDRGGSRVSRMRWRRRRWGGENPKAVVRGLCICAASWASFGACQWCLRAVLELWGGRSQRKLLETV